MKKISSSVLIVVLALPMATALLWGCRSQQNKKKSAKPVKTADEKSQEEVAGGRRVIMMGRSVMAGWFEHWGSDTSTPVERDGFTLCYKELSELPDIVDSVKDCLSEVSDKETIIFFKLCFADFVGGTKQEAEQNLSENKKYVREVCNLVVEEHGLKLIIGNALPQVKNDTDSYLVRNNQQYNEYLEELAQRYGDKVLVFDEYSILVDNKGNLKSDYANDPYDSHLNDEAYTALDESFFKLLEENF